MKSREIEILERKVMVGYCAATENAYERMTGKSIEVFNPDKEGEVHATIEDVMYLAIGGIIAYYASINEDAPIVDKDILFEASPTDRKTLMDAIVELRFDWYGIPAAVYEKIKKEQSEAKGDEEPTKN